MDEAINKNRVFGVDDPKELGRILSSHIIATKFIMVTVILSRPTGTTAVNCAINSVVSTNLSGNMVIIEDMNCKIDIIEGKENIK